jgi:hypothetical protein
VAPKGAGSSPVNFACLNPPQFEALTTVRSQQGAEPKLKYFCSFGSRPSKTPKATTYSSTRRRRTKQSAFSGQQETRSRDSEVLTTCRRQRADQRDLQELAFCKSLYALPIRIPEANTSAPPRTTCSADMKYRNYDKYSSARSKSSGLSSNNPKAELHLEHNIPLIVPVSWQ